MSQFVRVNVEALDDVTPAIFNQMIKNLKVGNGTDVYALDTTRKIVVQPKASGSRKSDEVDAALTRNGKVLPIGFKFIKEKGKTKLNIRGDFWNTGFEQNTFTEMISQQYMVTKIKHDAKINGNTIVKQEVKQNGDIVVRIAV